VEVIGVVDNQWMFVPALTAHAWTPLRPKLNNTMKGSFAADFDGDGATDIAFTIGQAWEISLSARANPSPASGLTSLPGALAIGRFDGAAAGAEVLFWQGNVFFKTSLKSTTPARQSRQDMR